MKNILVNSIHYKNLVDIYYLSGSGVISTRRIRVLTSSSTSISAYCFLRKAKRTFKYENILAAMPVFEKERDVI